uniref:Uncharacterized protein n=1 Tax=Oryza nivara TaxID=4536 RepID=A0A0E0G7B0_ORYNI
MADSGQHGRRCKWMMGGTSGEMRVAGMAMRVWVAGTTGVVGREASDSAGNGMARAAGCSSDLSTRSSTSLSSLWQISTTKSGMQLLSTVTPPMSGWWREFDWELDTWASAPLAGAAAAPSVVVRLRSSRFSFQTSPSSYTSFFQMGTDALTRR